MNAHLIKQLREETGCSIMACKQALEEKKDDIKEAREYLKKHYQEALVSQKSERETANGIIAGYVHNTKRVGALVEIHCETDFVANTREFQALAQEVALQIVAMNPSDTQDLIKQEYVRDSKKTIQDIIREAVGKLGENISVTRFSRFEL